MGRKDSPEAGPSRRRRVSTSDSEEEVVRQPKRRKTPEKIIDETPVGDSDLEDLNSEPGSGIVVASQDPPERRKVQEKNGQERVNGSRHDDEPNSDVDGEQEVEGQEDDDDDIPNGGTIGQVEFRPEYDRDEDGFVAGSITRIKCKGFMTYDFVEFAPGPHLNMILGPNGTGKSTIAAAIAIGLGFPPKVMGRANDLKSYVKQGTEQAETEIELKNKRGKRNIVIKRRFTRDDDKSEWFLNGIPSTKRAIVEIVADFGVQANNLCSFLAQDKVADFAKMAPEKVLEETIKAAGDPRLTKWHKALIDKGEKARMLESTLETETATRDNLQVKVDQMAPEVAHFHQRKEQELQREILECLVWVAEVTALQKEYTSRRTYRSELKERKRRVTMKRKPLYDLQTRQQNVQKAVESKARDAEDKLKGYQKHFSNAKRRFDDAIRETNQVTEDLKELRKKLKKIETEKEDCRRRIENAKRILEAPREELDEQIAAKRREKRDLQERQRAAEREYITLQTENRESEDRLKEIRKQIEIRAAKLQQLDSLELLKEQIARDQDGSINWLLDWLDKNEQKLEAKVHKPPMISVNVRNRDYAWQIEACTNLSQRKTFICESKRDYEVLVKLLNGQYGARRDSQGRQQRAGQIRFNVQHVEVSEKTVNPQRPCNVEQLKRLGFIGFAIDLIDAAPAVVAYLNGAANFHKAAISRQPGNMIDSDEVVKYNIPTWVTATDINRVSKSNYGKRDAQITSSPPVPARAFHHVVDKAAIEKIAKEKGELMTQLQEEEGPGLERKQKMEKALKKSSEMKKEMETLETEHRALTSQLSKYHSAQQDYDISTRKLAELEKRKSSEEQIERLRAERVKLAQKVLKPIQDFSAAGKESIDTMDELIVNGFGQLQAQINCSAISEKVDQGDIEIEEVDREIHDVDQEVDRLKHKHNQALARSQEAVRGRPREILSIVKEKSKDVGTPQEVRTQLDAVIADLEMSAGVDHNFVARYERLQKDLERSVELVKKQEKDLSTLKAQIDKILGQFDPALNCLVDVVSAKFSAAFEKVGCSGEVKIDRRDLDFASWGIRILVSYRDGEGLQVLTASRQSGGERALATVTYIMSLSEMARTPFSLVDEINQGMDQIAERNVHNQLVEVTCAPDAGQYFLITPKLLTDLRYNERMKMLIVNNGTWLPDGMNRKMQWGNLASCLKKYRNAITAH